MISQARVILSAGGVAGVGFKACTTAQVEEDLHPGGSGSAGSASRGSGSASGRGSAQPPTVP